MNHKTPIEELFFSKVDNARDGIKRNESPHVDLFAEHLDHPSCLRQDTSHEGARRLIRVLNQLDSSSKSCDDFFDEEKLVDDGKITCTVDLSADESNNQRTFTKNDESSKNQIQSMRNVHFRLKEKQDKEDLSTGESGEDILRRKKITKLLSNGEKVEWLKVKHEYEIMSYSQLEEKNRYKAKEVLDFHKDMKQHGNVLLCGLFLKGKCDYLTKDSRRILNHMINHLEKNIPLPLKIVNYPCNYKDKKIYKYLIKTYCDLKKDRPALAKKVLALYKEQWNKNKWNKNKWNVHLCGLYLKGKCEYFNTNSRNVRSHISYNHSSEKSVQIIKIISYPGCGKTKIPVMTELMTYSQLKEKNEPLAERVLKYYYGHKKHTRGCKIHICFRCLNDKCDIISTSAWIIRGHMKRKHSKRTSAPIYKIINYPLNQ